MLCGGRRTKEEERAHPSSTSKRHVCASFCVSFLFCFFRHSTTSPQGTTFPSPIASIASIPSDTTPSPPPLYFPHLLINNHIHPLHRRHPFIHPSSHHLHKVNGRMLNPPCLNQEYSSVSTLPQRPNAPRRLTAISTLLCPNSQQQE